MVLANHSDIKKPWYGKDIPLFILVAWPYFLNDLYLIPLSGASHARFLWVLDFMFYTTIPVLTLLFLYKKGYLRFARIGLGSHPTKTGILLAIFGAIATHVIITSHVEPWLFQHNCFRTCSGYPFLGAGVTKLGLMLYAALSAGFLEEIIFRGILVTILQKHIKRHWVIIVLSGLIFASIHWCLGGGKMVSTFLIGLVSTVAFLRTGRLGDLIIYHFLVDFLAF